MSGTVAFDVIGTLFSLAKPREALTGLGAPEHALELWFAQALRDAFAWSHAGRYTPLAEVLSAALPRTLGSLDVDVSEKAVSSVLERLSQLDPAPGAEEACAGLSEAGWRLLALTNGSERNTRTLLDRSGLAERFSAVLSCDAVETTKPHPDVYAMAAKQADGELWLVAAHAWDVAGAKNAGLSTVWVSALEGTYLDAYPQPDETAEDLRGAAQVLLDRSG